MTSFALRDRGIPSSLLTTRSLSLQCLPLHIEISFNVSHDYVSILLQNEKFSAG